jgi:hypothetical protein
LIRQVKTAAALGFIHEGELADAILGGSAPPLVELLPVSVLKPGALRDGARP